MPSDDLRALCDAVRAALPELPIADADLAALAAATAPLEQVTHERGVDLMLAILAGRGEPLAMTTLERHHAATIGATCHRFASRDHAVDDLRQILRAALFVAPSGGRPKIAEYRGTGSLANWIRVIAVRVFIDLIRRKDRTREALAGEDSPEPVGIADLALDAIKLEHRAIVATALREAASSLPAGTRHLLREHLVHGASIDQVGAALGLHRSTAARRIARAQEELVTETRRRVAERLAVPDRELDEICGFVASGIDVSMKTLLATPRPAA